MEQPNRLIHEKSPYLLQHSKNPIDWYPWGKEAFIEAVEKDKPIFLSIGYATCHWCHVMEKESFCNKELADIMNDSFVCIKVDREELPEVDNLYMEFAQALLPNGAGWPLNMFLTPDRKPFFATTYLPPDQGDGMLGLRQVAVQVKELWSGERDLVFAQSQEIVDLFEEANVSKGEELPTSQTIENAVDSLFEIVDPAYGGVKGAPKFPMSYQMAFLLAYSKTFDDSRTLFFSKLTLDMMRKGGIYDHVGGGFSRYCIDDKWSIPHFEKMLSDNALLASIYLDVFKFSKESVYLDTVSEILEFVLQEMTQESGGFFSAQDADSNGKEGGYYTWTYEEVVECIPQDHLKIFCDYFGVTKEGNFHGSNVLNCPETLVEFADLLHVDPLILKEILDPLLESLKEKREEREKPFLDDKILTSWNGLMIDTLAKAAKTLKKEDWFLEAIKATEFIIENLFDEKSEVLLRRWRDNQADYKGLIDDYAFFTKALITLFEMGADAKYLILAERLTNILQERFKEKDGAFFMVESDQDLILNKCEFYDGSIPSGNAVHSENLLRLHAITQNAEYLAQAEDIFRAAKTFMESYSPGACYHLLSFERYLHTKTPIIIIHLDKNNTYEEELLEILSSKYLPHTSIVWSKGLSYSYLEEYPLVDGKTTLYIVKKDHDSVSLTDLNEMEKSLMNL